MSAERVIHLVERRTRRCRLRRDDLDFLIAHHRPHLDIRATHRRGVFDLSPRGVVGAISAPWCRVEISPKIPLANLLHLIDPDNSLSLHDGNDQGLIDWLATRFAELLHQQAAAGLRSGYVEREAALPFLRGRLDVAAQAREPNPARDRLHCRFDDLVLDTPANRQVKAVAELVLGCPLVGGGVRARLRQATEALAGVGEEPAAPETLSSLFDDPRCVEYRSLLEAGRLFLDALSAGGARPAFLLDLERAFERYIARGLQRGVAGSDIRVEVQPWSPIHAPAPADQPMLHVRPDIVLRRGERLLAAIDAKWKRLRPGPEADDVHQALGYAAALGTGRVVLVYPGGRDRFWDYDVVGSPLRLGVHRLRVNGSVEACAAALRRWSAAVAGV